MTLNRRDMLKIGGLGAIGATGIWGAGSAGLGGSVLARTASELATADFPTPFTTPFVTPPVLRPAHWEYNEAGKLIRQHFHLTPQQTTVKILPRLTTQLWGYNGLVPGPTIKMQRGVESVVRVRNALPALHPLFGHEFTTSTHLHGSASLPQYDGYADDVTPPGFYKDYYYPNYQPARTIWYHDHAVHNTAQNVYSGLVAQYHIHDPQEKKLLPQGKFDVPLTVMDAMFAANGELAYDDESHSGLYGDVILVNGRPWPTMRVQKRVYRFRFLTASVSRSYRFHLSTGDPMHVVATDGGLMPQAQSVTQWRQGSAERYEVLIDFRHYSPGQRVVLENLSNDNNRDYDHTNKVMAFEVLDDSFGEGVVDKSDPTWNRIPTQVQNSHAMGLSAADAVTTRHLRFERQGGEWTIDGDTWADVVSSSYQKVLANPGLGDIELWTIENSSGGWFHPVHIHLIDFRILNRNGQPALPHELGPKDVVYLGENETVQVVAQFGDPNRPKTRGRYMVHCHNLVHEDHDMMAQFSVGYVAGAIDENDPIQADPCDFDDLPAERGVAPGNSRAPESRALVEAVEVFCFDPDDDGGDLVTGYRIRGYIGAVLVQDFTVNDEHLHVLQDLDSESTYTFTSAGVNETGEGPQSPRSIPATPLALGAELAPAAPVIERARTKDNSVELKWEPPEDPEGSITGFQVRVLDGSTGRPIGGLRRASAEADEMMVSALAPGRSYRFQVRAINGAGPGPFSGRSNLVTLAAPDRIRPGVVAIRPALNARNVRRGANVTARFTERVEGVNRRSVILRRANGRRVAARISYNPRTGRVTINPRRRLAPNTEYTVRFTRGIRDAAGNRLVPAAWSFTTGRRN